MKTAKIIFIIIIITLVGLRIYLPYCLLSYVKSQINKIPEYQVNIADLDIHLYRGSYTLKKIQLWKTTSKIPVPYFQAQSIDFSVEWPALLKGKLVATVIAESPILNFVTDPGKNEQITISSRWIEIVKTLFPLNINRLDARDSQIYFRSFRGNPPFDTYVKKADLTIQNMQNAKKSGDMLPSFFHFTAIPIGGGKIEIQGHFDPFAKQPTFDLTARLNELNIVKIANFLKHYTHIDVESGIFNLYSEVAAAKGQIKGYAKPFFKNLKIGSPKDASPLSAVASGLAKVATKILKNPEQKTIATKINISGNIDDPDTSLLSIIGYLIQHAFINALMPKIDESISMQDVWYGKKPAKDSQGSPKKIPQYRY